MGSEPEPLPSRRQEIDTRLNVVRGRLKELRERERYGVKNPIASASERLEAARRHATEARAAAAEVLASSVEAFRRAAMAHERAASAHERAAAAGIGDVRRHERQAAFHRAAAAADWTRAERTGTLLIEPEPAQPAAGSDEPGSSAVP